MDNVDLLELIVAGINVNLKIRFQKKKTRLKFMIIQNWVIGSDIKCLSNFNVFFWQFNCEFSFRYAY